MCAISRVAVIDDDADKRDSLSEFVSDAQFTPIIIPGPFRKIDKFVSTIKSQADAAICDHRLQTRKYASFFGAEAVASLYTNGVPAILITSWGKVDEGLMRSHRSQIPVLMAREDLSCEEIIKALEICVKEISGEVLPTRKTWRTLLRVEGLTKVGNKIMADIIIPSWNPNEGVRVPIELFGRLRNKVAAGRRFFAKVNTGAVNSADLYFKDFELAPALTKKLCQEYIS
jgi:FixJ family two-component response regulator